jgi:hypothetical protein
MYVEVFTHLSKGMLHKRTQTMYIKAADIRKVTMQFVDWQKMFLKPKWLMTKLFGTIRNDKTHLNRLNIQTTPRLCGIWQWKNNLISMFDHNFEIKLKKKRFRVTVKNAYVNCFGQLLSKTTDCFWSFFLVLDLNHRNLKLKSVIVVFLKR